MGRILLESHTDNLLLITYNKIIAFKT